MAYGCGMGALNPIPPAQIAARLRELGITRGNVLDVGCGRGDTLRCLARELPALRLWGVDLEPPQAPEEDFTRCVGTGEALPYPDGRFDLLLAECSFSLMENPAAAAGELGRVLVSGGRLLLTDLYTPGESFSLPAPGLLRNVFHREALAGYFTAAGFTLLDFRDHTPALTDMVIRMVLEGSFCACLNPGGLDILKKNKPHYGIWLFEKTKGEEKHGSGRKSFGAL